MADNKEEQNKIEKLVPDTSVIIDGAISKKIRSNELVLDKIVIHEAVISELEHQMNLNKAIGFLGIEELEALRKLSVEKGFQIEFAGVRPKPVEIHYASLGEIDAMVRDLAFETDSTLVTADNTQSRVARAKGIKVILIEISAKEEILRLGKYFDEFTMSVHLRENTLPFAKKGRPGKWDFVPVENTALQRQDIEQIWREIIEVTGKRDDAFIEIERPGSTIVQLGNFRIVMTKPPLSDGWEITAVRPIKKMSLADYNLSEKLKLRIAEQAEGILIAGAPGHGKSTFAQALAEFYASKNKVVKTVEAPRDLVLPDSITQYAISHGDAQEIHDILLLSRPDYTIFDEMRNTKDFELYADLRLSGIGLAGVVHATNPIDAIQRFVGRIELGVIPQIIDTVIFIKDGAVSKVLSLSMTVKVPSGMTEADLARPVVVVNDFETKKLEYELYSYGEETVVIPVRGSSKTPESELAAKAIEQELLNYTRKCKVDVVSSHKAVACVPAEDIARIIGKQGANIEKLEKKLGIGLDIRELERDAPATGKNIEFDAKITSNHVLFSLDRDHINKNMDIYIDDDYVLTANVSKKAIIKITKKNKIGKILVDAINMHENIRLVEKKD